MPAIRRRHLEVKEVIVGDWGQTATPRRYIICFNPEDAKHDDHRSGIGQGRMHWCPLPQAYLVLIDGWSVFPNATYLADQAGRPFSEDALRRRLKRYVADDPVLAAAGILPHGLRALAVCDRRIAGDTHQRIAAAIGMSLRQVMSYSRHIDQRLAAGKEREQNEAMKTDGSNLKTTSPK